MVSVAVSDEYRFSYQMDIEYLNPSPTATRHGPRVSPGSTLGFNIRRLWRQEDAFGPN